MENGSGDNTLLHKEQSRLWQKLVEEIETQNTM